MTHPPDPIEQLAAELSWKNFETKLGIAKLIKVAAEQTREHIYVCRECREAQDGGQLWEMLASCWADTCQRIREGMEKP